MEGKDVPDVTLYENAPDAEVKLKEALGTKKAVVVAVPGAFTPGCSQSHIPSFVNKYDDLKQAGAELIIVVAGNDPFVMQAWGNHLGGSQKGMRFMSDFKLDLAKALGVDQEISFLGGPRLKRFSMVVNNGKIMHLNVESDGLTPSCSMADPTL